ncbi:aspartate aminotransferase family protein, partial [Staphylococcus pasteuri_A]|nr:aspartate aminotransferase family protein [Staphylococcus pasteuri_A]
LSNKFCDITRGDYVNSVSFGLRGSDGNDVIFIFAREFSGRPYIFSFTNAYHGSAFGAVSMSAISLNLRKSYGPLLNGVYHSPFP